jgi:hypothetical protein
MENFNIIIIYLMLHNKIYIYFSFDKILILFNKLLILFYHNIIIFYRFNQII